MGARRYPEEIRRAVESERLVHRNITTDASIAQITAANVAPLWWHNLSLLSKESLPDYPEP